MAKRTLFIGIGLASLMVGGALAQTQVDGLDLEAIDKRAHAGAADLSKFVAEVLGRQTKANAEQHADVEALVDSATRKAASIKPPAGQAAPGGVDLDGLAGDAGQAIRPEARAAPMFIAFASLSMPADSLERLIADVSKAGGMVVFRGFPASGGRTFMEQLRKVVPQGEQAHISIDPRLFRAYRVEAVPTYVAASASFTLCSAPDCVNEPTPFDRLSGNVTAHFALDTIADGNGPGASVARAALANLDRAP